MAKKCLIMLVLAIFIAGGVFAQTNTVTVDIGPTIVGLAFGQVGNLLKNLADEAPNINSSGFGIGAQYERQVLRQLGIAARFAYLGVGFNMGENFTDSGVSGSYSIGMDIKTISAEAHARFYPGGNVFFLGGMVGYGNLTMDLSGKVMVYGYGNETVKITAPRNYAKLGARLGWRIDFGNPGGFVFEPSFGYDHAFGLGATFGRQLQNAVTGEVQDMRELDEMFGLIESFVFVGGPRVSLAFGWRF